jgi:hypothetical protein
MSVRWRNGCRHGRELNSVVVASKAAIPVKGESHCAIEAKCGAVASFAALMDNPRGTKFTEWWHQVNYDCTLAMKAFNREFYPMMFFRPYPNQNWVAISERLFSNYILKPREGGLTPDKPLFPHFHFSAYPSLGEISFNVVRTNNKKNYVFVPLLLDAVILCRWKDFAANVDPASFFYELPYQNYGVEGNYGVLPKADESDSGDANCGAA